MATPQIPFRLSDDQTKLQEFEAGDCIDPSLVEPDPQVATNTANIALNNTAIAANTADIASNSTNIAGNTTAVANAQSDATQALTDAAAANANANTRLQSVQAGTNVTVDNTDPLNPVVSAADGGPPFTPFFQFAENLVVDVQLGESATDLLDAPGDYEQYLTLTTPSLETGTYVVTVDYLWNYDQPTTDVLIRTTLNGDLTNREALISAHRQQPADSLGANTADDPGTAAGVGPSGSNQWLSYSTRRVLVGLSGVNTFVLEHSASAAGQESTLIRATITIERKA